MSRRRDTFAEKFIKNNPELLRGYRMGYRQATNDIVELVKKYEEKGWNCLETAEESQMNSFWDGFHNCAENILRELNY